MAIRILIEGLDRTGKSTTAGFLSEQYDIPVLHFGVPPDDGALSWYLEQFVKATQENPSGFIMDRFILSNRAYAGVFGGSVLNDSEYEYVFKILQENDVFLLLMQDKPERIHSRMQEEGKDSLTVEQIREIFERFYAESIRYCDSYKDDGRYRSNTISIALDEVYDLQHQCEKAYEFTMLCGKIERCCG